MLRFHLRLNLQTSSSCWSRNISLALEWTFTWRFCCPFFKMAARKTTQQLFRQFSLSTYNAKFVSEFYSRCCLFLHLNSCCLFAVHHDSLCSFSATGPKLLQAWTQSRDVTQVAAAKIDLPSARMNFYLQFWNALQGRFVDGSSVCKLLSFDSHQASASDWFGSECWPSGEHLQI